MQKPNKWHKPPHSKAIPRRSNSNPAGKRSGRTCKKRKLNGMML